MYKFEFSGDDWSSKEAENPRLATPNTQPPTPGSVAAAHSY